MGERWSKKKSWWRWTRDSFIMHYKSSTSLCEKIINLSLILWQELICKLAWRTRIDRLITRFLLTSSAYLSSLGIKSLDVSLFLDVIVLLIIIFNGMSKLTGRKRVRNARGHRPHRHTHTWIAPIAGENQKIIVMLFLLSRCWTRVEVCHDYHVSLNMVICFVARFRVRSDERSRVLTDCQSDACTFKQIARDKQLSSRGFSWVIW